jgi:hypothetical protein
MKTPTSRVQSQKYPGNLAEAQKNAGNCCRRFTDNKVFSFTQAHLIFKMGHGRLIKMMLCKNYTDQ